MEKEQLGTKPDAPRTIKSFFRHPIDSSIANEPLWKFLPVVDKKNRGNTKSKVFIEGRLRTMYYNAIPSMKKEIEKGILRAEKVGERPKVILN